MNFVEAVKSCFRQYATFSGRASRYEFWNFILFLFLVSIVLTIVNSLLFGPTISQEFTVQIDSNGQQTQGVSQTRSYDGGIFANIFGLVTVIPWFAVTWRRLHDTGRPGWYCLLPVVTFALATAVIFLTGNQVDVDQSQIPAGVEFSDTLTVPGNPLVFMATWLLGVGSIILVIVWLCRASDPQTNKYGPNPHEVPS